MDKQAAFVLHWNYRGFTEFPLAQLRGEETEITDIYLKENLISRLPNDIDRLQRLESLYLSGNDITELPVEISRLKCLKCLDVSGNRLRRIPEEIAEVRSLKFLILDDNELRELPLRLSELRDLRYLSVCDNKLQWLPQRPIYNYFHCEFRFWRNTDLKTIPYTLWFHMLRDQQTRSLNIGCLKVPQYQNLTENGRCRLKLQYNSRTWEVDIAPPYQYENIQKGVKGEIYTPPSLLEMSRRKLYLMINKAAKEREICEENYNYSNNIFNNNNTGTDIDENNNNQDDNNNDVYPINNLTLEQYFEDLSFTRNNTNTNEGEKGERKKYYVISDIIEEYFSYLPKFIKLDLCNGPISRCENAICKKPVFDFVTYEFCMGKIVLIDSTDDVILSAAFCSQSCADVWKGGKTNLIIPWQLIR